MPVAQAGLEQQAYSLRVVGSNPTGHTLASVDREARHESAKLINVGSNPTWRSMRKQIEIEYGLQHVCADIGCNPRHSDDGLVMKVPRERWIQHRRRGYGIVNNYRCRVVRRVIRKSEWK